MVKSQFRKWGLAGLVMLVALALLAACGQPAPAPSPTPSPKPSPAPTSSPAPSPAPSPKPSPTSSPTQSAADFYKDKVITMIIPYGAGGGTDYGGRIFASVWPDFVPGGGMVVKNMAGGGGLVGTNFMYTSKPDGLTVCLTETGSGLLAPILFDDPAAKFDPTKFEYLGAFGYSAPYMLVGKPSKYTKWEDLKGVSGFKFGATGVKSDNAVAAVAVADALGMTNTRLVAGYAGTAELSLSMGRGETDGAQAAAHVVEEWVSKGFAKPPFLVIDFQRSAWYKDVPALGEVVQLTEKQKGYVRMELAMASRKAIFLPPGVPKDRVEYLRGLFNKIMENAGFLALAKKNWAVWEKPITGEQYAQVVKDTLVIKPEEKTDIMNKIEAMSKL